MVHSKSSQNLHRVLNDGDDVDDVDANDGANDGANDEAIAEVNVGEKVDPFNNINIHHQWDPWYTPCSGAPHYAYTIYKQFQQYHITVDMQKHMKILCFMKYRGDPHIDEDAVIQMLAPHERSGGAK